MKTEIYSWRLSAELKSDLERKARVKKVPVSTVLDWAVRDWLKTSEMDAVENETQRELHDVAEKCFGVLAGNNPRRAETARGAVRERLRRRNGR